ncbi:hypothetical protein CC2G_007762 [Coprinopsis cinerea AmutBmut pab1-1]|nr:hypothetical protein CC2G_007762 [Coprinopsis cinerea AmutBmut pab1-1]
MAPSEFRRASLGPLPVLGVINAGTLQIGSSGGAASGDSTNGSSSNDARERTMSPGTRSSPLPGDTCVPMESDAPQGNLS